MTRPQRGTTAHRQWIIGLIGTCAEDTGSDIDTLARNTFLEWSRTEENTSGVSATWEDVKVYGGWPQIRQYAKDQLGAGEAPSREVLSQTREVTHGNTHRRSLERLVGDVEYITRRLRDSLADAIEKNPPKLTKLTKPTVNWEAATQREVVVLVSDTHFGQCVDPEEVLGGRYDWTIAARRMAKLVFDVAHYKPEHKKNTGLRLVFNGDLLEGRIHNDDRGVDVMAAQIDGARQIIVAMIDYLRQHFPRIDVMCQTGNHERWPFRGPGRPTAQKFDSATTVVMRGVEQVFRHCQDIRFHLPLAPFSIWESCGWRLLATHGDDFFQVGSPSKGFRLDTLFSRFAHLEGGHMFGGRVHMVMLGHYHFPMICRMPGSRPQAWLAINGCASGNTAFTQTIGIPFASPVQTYWEVTNQSPVNDYQMSDLDKADHDKKWEDIVPVPTTIGYQLPKLPGTTTDFYALAGAVEKIARSKR